MAQDNTTQPQGLLSLLSGGVTQQITSSLPTQGQVIQAYMGAILAFWIVGGITLYFVSKVKR